MNNKSGHNGKNQSDDKALFDQFSDDEKARVKKLWEMSTRAATKEPEVTSDDIENALNKVHKKIGENSGQSTTHRLFNWKWMAAAAVILIMAGAGILFTPQTTTAPYGELSTVELPDGSTVELNSGSQIWYNRLYAFSNRTVNLDGEAYFSVKAGVGSDPFIVNANNSTIRVTGTEFNVRSWSGDPDSATEVAVSEGSVQFYPADNPGTAVTISPGQLSTLSAGLAKPTPPEPVTIDRVIGWRDRMLIFNDKSLPVIFKELERRFDTEIRLEDESMADETLTTYYAAPDNVESVLEDICRVKGLRYSETANGYRVYR